MTGKLRSIALLLLGALLALSSCRDLALDPVFYALSQEQPLAEDRLFPDAVTVHRVLKVGTRYFAAANQLYSRGDGADDNWTGLDFPDFPDSPANPLCNALEEFGGRLYASFYDNKDGLGLYRSLPSPISWEQIADFGAASGAQITMLKAAGGRLFATVATWTGDAETGHFEYSLAHSGTGDSGDFLVLGAGDWDADAADRPNADLPIRDVASDGSYYWVIVGNRMYADDSGVGVGTFAKLSPESSGSSYYGGLLYDATGPTLYLSAGNGLLMSSADFGSSWTASATIVDADEDPIPFAQFVLPASDAGAVYVGTRGFGYYRIPSGNVDPSGTAEEVQDFWDGQRYPSYTYSALYNGAITSMYFDAAKDALFIGTAGSGLWRGDHDSGSDWSWKQE